MQIKGLLTGLQTYEQSKINKMKDKGDSGKARAGSSPDSDKVTLSQGAKLYKTGLEQAMNADEVRTDRVEELSQEQREQVLGKLWEMTLNKVNETML